MANGTTDDKLHEIRKLVDDINANGCSKREVDALRIATVEKATESHGRKLDKIYYTSLVTAGGIIAFLLKAFAPLVLGK